MTRRTAIIPLTTAAGATGIDVERLAQMLGRYPGGRRYPGAQPPQAHTSDTSPRATRVAVSTAQVDAAHVDATIARLTASHELGDSGVTELRTAFTASGRGGFDSLAATFERVMPKRKPAIASGGFRPAPQGAPMLFGEAGGGESLDALEQLRRGDPRLLQAALRAARAVGITPENIRDHGPSTFNAERYGVDR